MSHSLIIVESPTKAKTISKFVGKGYTVLSSFGHVRDLPKSKMGIDIEHDFEPKYLVPKEKKERVKALKEAAKKADEILFATDEDREGEAISWHLAEILDVEPKKLKRITFHEITKRAIDEALAHPRGLDMHRVDAQQARRILDRLVGYELSPFLWRKVQRGLSAGRVQSVSTRLIVERERERNAFVSEEYWSIEALLAKGDISFPGKLVSTPEKKLEKFDIPNETEAKQIIDALAKASYTVSDVRKKETTQKPSPPFTTSSLQQEANRKLGMTAKQTMQIAQQLYEGITIPEAGQVGLITYMRTDSVTLSDLFLEEAGTYIRSVFGTEYSIPAPRKFETKSKGAQEAHEAIRPTDPTRDPASLKEHLEPNQYKLYNLIWQRALATQMKDATLNTTSVDILANGYMFRASGSVIVFDGFLKLYPKKQDEVILPDLKIDDLLSLLSLEPKQHFTEPPPRYSDAGLIKVLEEYGIGRPSTYAPTIGTIIERGYIERDEQKRLKPKPIAETVHDLLVAHFPSIVDYEFTAKMEEQFDDIAEGKTPWVPVIRDFYTPFHENLEKKDAEVPRIERPDIPTDVICGSCGKLMVIKQGRFGAFLACSNYPECKNTKQMKDPSNTEHPEIMTVEDICPTCGAPMEVKQGRFGLFISCTRYPECKTIKKMEKKLGIPCPECKQGELVEKRSKQKRPFYGCNRYPDCTFALWQKPTGASCPTCGSMLVLAAKEKVKCSSKTCDYETSAEPTTTTVSEEA